MLIIQTECNEANHANLSLSLSFPVCAYLLSQNCTTTTLMAPFVTNVLTLKLWMHFLNAWRNFNFCLLKHMKRGRRPLITVHLVIQYLWSTLGLSPCYNFDLQKLQLLVLFPSSPATSMQDLIRLC